MPSESNSTITRHTWFPSVCNTGAISGADYLDSGAKSSATPLAAT